MEMAELALTSMDMEMSSDVSRHAGFLRAERDDVAA